MSTADIVAAVDDELPSSVKSTLSRLVQSGHLDRVAYGYYAMPSATHANGVSPTFSEPGGDDLRVYIPLVSAHVSAGPGSDVWQPEIEEYITVSESVIKRETGVSSSRLVAFIAVGTSMVPTIMPGDRLIVARANGEPVIDRAVYVWRSRYDGMAVKRAVLLEGGGIALQGDNDTEPVGNILPHDDDPPWSVIGRVIRVEKPL